MIIYNIVPTSYQSWLSNINNRYFNQKRKQMKTVYIQGTDGLTDMVKWIWNYTSYTKDLLKKILTNI